MLTTIKESLKNVESFGFESTLSGKTWIPILREAQTRGYEIVIYFLYLEKVAENIRRIKIRVAQGGHSIPAETVRRRHPRVFENFWTLSRPLSSNWLIVNNSGKSPKQIHNKKTFSALLPRDQTRFEVNFLKGLIK